MKLEENIQMIPIWGNQIPGNTGEDKKIYMQPDLSLRMNQLIGAKGGIWDKSSDEITNTVCDDTMVWKDEIENGYAKGTMNDVPFLIPYLVPGSKKAVIACPGGAYLFKSLQSEGEDIAGFLNEAGISCFVLWYRSAPYQMPYMFLDLQRAIRFVRFHANEYGIDPNQISTVGFSAGGNLNGVTAINFGNQPVDIEGYMPDEIDQVDGRANAIAMCYPAVCMGVDKAFKVLIGLEAYQDRPRRMELAKTIDMIENLHADVPPMFLCCCEDDDVVPPINLSKLNTRAMELGIPTEFHMFPYGGHGFGGCVVYPNSWSDPDYSAVEEWKRLYVKWLNHIFK